MERGNWVFPGAIVFFCIHHFCLLLWVPALTFWFLKQQFQLAAQRSACPQQNEGAPPSKAKCLPGEVPRGTEGRSGAGVGDARQQDDSFRGPGVSPNVMAQTQPQKAMRVSLCLVPRAKRRSCPAVLNLLWPTLSTRWLSSGSWAWPSAEPLFLACSLVLSQPRCPPRASGDPSCSSSACMMSSASV